VKVDGNPISLETLSSLNSFKFLSDIEKMNNQDKDINIMEQKQEQEQMNEALFHHFKLR
jgi:hypothetical protein